MAANLASAHFGMVPLGLGLAVSAGTFAAGLALVLRDAVHETAGERWAYVAVALGAVLSALTAGPALALASTAAFAVSELVDAVVYGRLRRHSRALAVLGSGAIGAPLDTIVFLWLAPFPVTAGGVIGQVLVKLALSALGAALVMARPGREVAVA